MNKSKKSITVEYLAKLACLNVDRLYSGQAEAEFNQEHIKVLRQIRNDLAHSHNSGDFSSQIPSHTLYDELKKRLRQGTSLQESGSNTETAKFFTTSARGSETVNSLPQESESNTEIAKSFATSARVSETANSLPPKNAEFLLALFLGKEDQEAAIGCFTELYSKRVVRLGKSRARLWAWVQVGKTLVPVLKRVVLKVSGLIAAYEWLKHHLS